MAKYYLQIEVASLVSGKIDKAASVVIDGVTYAGTVKGAMEIGDLQSVPSGTKPVVFKVDSTGKIVNADVTL